MPTLHLLCGKMAAGKSTLATKLSHDPGTVLIAEDAWLSALYADELKTGQDYLRCAEKLRSVLGPHVVALLGSGVSVVLDLPANTVDSRRWMRGLIDASGADHQMHVLDPPDEVCLARLRARNAGGAHEFAPTEAQFLAFAKHFAPPTADEGFNVIRYTEAQ